MSGGAVVEWRIWSTLARLVLSDPRPLPMARALVDRELAAVDAAANRFRDDSEIRRLHRDEHDRVTLSPTLAWLLREALSAAWYTAGDVDPTVGAAMAGIGYDRDFALVLDDERPVRLVVRPVPGWQQLRLHGRELTLPAGVALDLGATAKAAAADRCAAVVHRELGVGVLVSLGGDVATAGPAPMGGWQVQVQDLPSDPRGQVTLPAGAAIATSSTMTRRWRRGAQTLHHIVDPRTGLPAASYWQSVTVAAPRCREANAVSTTVVVRGPRAVPWLTGLGLPARLLSAAGEVVTVGGWPAEVAA
jgi:thiamine biosynthesis lipoprotein